LRFCGLGKLVRYELVFAAGAFDGRDEIPRRERFLRSEQESFDYLAETHMSYTTYTTYIPIAL